MADVVVFLIAAYFVIGLALAISNFVRGLQLADKLAITTQVVHFALFLYLWPGVFYLLHRSGLLL